MTDELKQRLAELNEQHGPFVEVEPTYTLEEAKALLSELEPLAPILAKVAQVYRSGRYTLPPDLVDFDHYRSVAEQLVDSAAFFASVAGAFALLLMRQVAEFDRLEDEDEAEHKTRRFVEHVAILADAIRCSKSHDDAPTNRIRKEVNADE
ncbi:MAG TPA: hypothetical protein VFV52_10240 [Bacilli bacterium]|nr:hypothetical protein [Bacilli bacterium]